MPYERSSIEAKLHKGKPKRFIGATWPDIGPIKTCYKRRHHKKELGEIWKTEVVKKLLGDG